MTICADPRCERHYGCRLRRKGLRFSSKATPTQRNLVAPRKANASWEAGVKAEDRGDGFQMPYIRADGTRFSVKEFADERGTLEQRVQAVKAGALDIQGDVTP